jgi:hypothetical protein
MNILNLCRRAVQIAAIAFPFGALAEPPPEVELKETVDGKPLDAFANLWWQWAFSMPQDISPVRDETGVYCDVGQSGPVWFLAGGYGSANITRSCDIPAGKHLFFPVINMLAYTPPGEVRPCASLQEEVARNNDTFVYLRVSLDGIPIENAERFRLASKECFDPFSAASQLDIASYPTDAATDGYWIMLRPLPPGAHHLEFRAFYTNPDEALGDAVQNIVYDLNVLAD